MKDSEKKAVRKDFKAVVNMKPTKLEKWLDSADSKKVGQKKATTKTAAAKKTGTKKTAAKRSTVSRESTGHQSGRRIVTIQRTKKTDLTDNDYAHMRKVVGYVKRHTAQRPKGDVSETRWRYSLMNWGHDPMKKSA